MPCTLHAHKQDMCSEDQVSRRTDRGQTRRNELSTRIGLRTLQKSNNYILIQSQLPYSTPCVKAGKDKTASNFQK